MNKYHVAAVAIALAIMGGCANMGGMVGTSSVQADSEANFSYPIITPKTMVYSE